MKWQPEHGRTYSTDDLTNTIESGKITGPGFTLEPGRMVISEPDPVWPNTQATVNLEAPMPDPVNHPPHYTWLPGGVEVIDITESLNFCLGNAVKYLLRADHKGNPEQDLRKARWYIDRELDRRTRAHSAANSNAAASSDIDLDKFRNG